MAAEWRNGSETWKHHQEMMSAPLSLEIRVRHKLLPLALPFTYVMSILLHSHQTVRIAFSSVFP